MKVIELPAVTLIQTGPYTYVPYNKDGTKLSFMEELDKYIPDEESSCSDNG